MVGIVQVGCEISVPQLAAFNSRPACSANGKSQRKISAVLHGFTAKLARLWPVAHQRSAADRLRQSDVGTAMKNAVDLLGRADTTGPCESAFSDLIASTAAWQ